MKPFSKKKRIEQLEAQLAERDRKIHRLEDIIAHHEMKFEDMRKMLESKPEDCRIGEYCKTCSFSKAYRILNRHRDDFDVLYLCNKAGSCQHFTQKEE